MVPDSSKISGMLDVAIEAAQLAGQRAMDEIKHTRASIKNGREMVTTADRLCQQLIIDRITQDYPSHGFIGEEGEDGAVFKHPPAGSESVWWVIDPIDGTNNYAHGMMCFCVSIAAVCDGLPIVGVIFEPATGSMYTAAKDTAAKLNGSEITASQEQINEFASFGIDSHFGPELADGIGKIIRQTRFRNLGTTAMHLAYVAKGSFLGTITSIARIWDIAAGTIIIENAGGIVTDIAGAKIFPVDMENCTGKNYQLLTANNKTHSQILKMLTL